MDQPSSPPNDHTDAGLGGPDDWIVRIARDGDGDSFIELFQSFAPRIKSYLIRSGLAEGVAEEIAQETLFTAWRKAGRFNPCRASAAAWLFTIARNLRIDLLRHDGHPGATYQDAGPAAPPTPEDSLGAAEGGRRLHDAIAELPSDQAVIVRLAFFEERSHSEIACSLGVPLGTVKSRIRLAAAHLRRELTFTYEAIASGV